MSRVVIEVMGREFTVVFDQLTVCRLEPVEDAEKETQPFMTGVARCSELDNFCKQTGRRIALGRILYGLGLPKAERKRILREV